MAEPDLLTVDEVAARLRLSRETVRRWLRVGRLQGVRLATERAGWRIPASEVDRILAPQQMELPAGKRAA